MASTTPRFVRITTETLLLLSVALFALGCGGPPKEAIEAAEQALREAVVVSSCAEKEFREAEEMLAQAKALVESGDYEEAEVKARLAQKLAESARKAGEERWEDCQKAKAPAEVAKVPDDEIDQLLKNGRLGAIYFDYDEATLTDQSQKTLQKNAEWMRRNAASRIQIEGHCDEQGTAEYNIALGERRAVAVRKYLVQLGIEGARLSIISYGSEVPALVGNTDASFVKNRRAEFLVQK